MAQVRKIKNDLQVALNSIWDSNLSDSEKLTILIRAVRYAIFDLSK